MKYICTIFFFFLCYSYSCFGQNKYWENSANWATTQNGKFLFLQSDTTYIVWGSTKNGIDTPWQGVSIATNNKGEILDLNIVPIDTLQSTVRDVILDEIGYVFVTEMIGFDSFNYHTYFMRANFLGELTHIKLSGNPNYDSQPKTIVPTSDGNYLIGGYIVPVDEFPYTREMYLIKVDSLGNQLEEFIYLEDEYETDCIIKDIYPAEDGGYYLVSLVDWVDDYSGDIMISKITEDGAWLWEEVYDFEGEDQCFKMQQLYDGGYLLDCSKTIDFTESNIVKLNSDFEFVWQAEELFPLCGSNVSIPVDTFNQITVGCNNTLTEYGAQMRIVKTDSLGQLVWFRDYGGLGHDYGYDIIHAPDGGFVISGRTESYPLDTASIYLVKVNCMGLISEPEAQFSSEQSGFSFDFMNESQYVYPDSIDGGHYFWDFGDGNVSNEFNPTHTYPEIGIYGASLTGIVCNDTSIYRQILCVGAEPTSIPHFSVNSDDGTLHHFENESILPNNFSLDYAHYTWDFGDGNSSTAIHPIHVYTESGSYTVTLSYTICDQIYEYSTEINVSTSTELLTEKTKINIYPNPAQDQAIITYDLGDFKSAALHLYDTQGRLVQVQSLDVLGKFTPINLSRLEAGLYVYEVVVDGERVGGDSLVVSR